MTRICAIKGHAGRWAVGGALALLAATWVQVAAEPPAESQPAPAIDRESAFDPQRLNDLLGLIEGQNSFQARSTGARELLRHNWPETVPRLTAILSRSNRPAKVAVALALSDTPGQIASDYVEPLLAMLADGEAEVRRAAATALASCPNEAILRRLRSLVLNSEERLTTRLAAIDSLGMMTRREAVAVLIEVLSDPRASIAVPALAALERATAQDFQGDIDAAVAWWDAAQEASLADWQRSQIERLARQSRVLKRHVQDVEQRLANALREGYYRTAEAERPVVLNAYLTDASATVRRLGLRLAQAKLTEGGTLAPETATHTRELLSAPEPLVREAAVRTVATLRDPVDAERFLQMLADERLAVVREALVNGLGYVGSASAVHPLLNVLESADSATTAEAITALGRLAERGVLDSSSRAAVSGALLGRVRTTPRDHHALRERLLWALSRVGDPQCGAEFVAALETPEAAAVRLAAARGIAVLVDPKTAQENGSASQPATRADVLSPRQLLDALAAFADDPDAGVRRAVVETLAQFGASDAHIEALGSRLSVSQEPDETVRTAAWRGAVRLLACRPLDQIEPWLDRLPDDGTPRGQRTLELLRAAEKNLGARPAPRGELGRVRSRIAAELADLNEIDTALSTYLTALEDLHAAQSPQTARVALELLRLALLSDRYDAQLAAALAQRNPPLDGQALWDGVRVEIEQRLQADETDRAIAMLAAFQGNPPTSMPADVQQTIEQLLQQARAKQAAADAASVKAALGKLRDNADDEQARQIILKLGPRAVPALREALRAALQAEQPETHRIRQLHDLLKRLVPDWPGFAPDASPTEKLKALDQIRD